VNWRAAAWPVYFARRGEAPLRLFAELDAGQWKPEAEIEQYSRQRLAELLRYSTTTVPRYTELDGAELDSFPVLSKQDLRLRGGQQQARDFSGRAWAVYSGGSTGEPTAVLADTQFHEWRTASGWRGDCFGGLHPTDRFLALWARQHEKAAASRGRQGLREWFFNRYLVDTFMMDEGRVRDIHAKLRQLRPRAIAGFVSGLVAFVDISQRLHLEPPSVAKVIPSAEYCPPATAAILGDYFGAPVCQRYGAREVGDIAHQCERGRWHIHSEHVRLEVLRADGTIALTGEGSLLVTCLSNRAMPIIRYEIGDAADISPDPCDCGRGLPTMKALQGRVMEFIYAPGGRLISSLVFNHLLKDAPIRQFRVVQHSMERLQLLLVPLPEYSARGIQPLLDYLAPVLGLEMRMDVELVQSIEPLPSGKHVHIINLLHTTAGTLEQRQD
jgi:phenylacetate-CoA ligase